MFNGSNTVAVMSVPRLGFNDAWAAAYNALAPHSIDLRQFGGAFWDQSFQSALEWCCADGYELIITLDYDTLFTPQDVWMMLSITENYDDIDALAAMQPRRSDNKVMATCEDQTVKITGEPIRVTSAHFGLTALRVRSLMTMSKPWIKGEPGSNGSWRDADKTDPDMWFWRQWIASALSLYMTPKVRIGHLELMVSEFDEKMQHRYIKVDEWKNRANLQVRKINEEAVA